MNDQSRIKEDFLTKWVSDSISKFCNWVANLSLMGKMILVLVGLAVSSGSMATAINNPWNRVPAVDCQLREVLPGETVSGIARSESRSLTELRAINPHIGDLNLVYPGDMICIDYASSSAVAGLELGILGGSPFDNDYTSENWNNHGPMPGATALAEALQEWYPEFGFTLEETHGVGIYNHRNARGGSSLSTHAAGRAIDFTVTECYGEDRQAYGMFSQLVKSAESLGIQRMVMCNIEWRSDRGYSTASDSLAAWHDGRKAMAHLHLELSVSAAENLTHERASVALGLESSVPAPEITPEFVPAPTPVSEAPLPEPVHVPSPSPSPSSSTNGYELAPIIDPEPELVIGGIIDSATDSILESITELGPEPTADPPIFTEVTLAELESFGETSDGNSVSALEVGRSMLSGLESLGGE